MNRFIACGITLGMALHFGLAPALAGHVEQEVSVDALYEQGQWQIGPDWRGLGKMHEAAVFLHNETRKAEDGLLAVWRDRELAFAEYIDKEKAYLSVRERVLVDCKLRNTGVSDSTYYAARFGAGAVVARKKVTNVDMLEAVPDSLEERMIQFVCGPEPGKTKSAKG